MNEILAKILPTIATVLAGPLGGMAVEIVGNALGMTDATKEKVTDVLTSGNINADQLAALKQAEMALKVRLRELDIQEEHLDIEDKESARARDVELAKAGLRNRRGDWLAFGAVGTLAFTIFGLFVFDIDNAGRDLLLVALGALVTICKDVYGFEFGSSKDSARSGQAVVDALKNGNGH